MPFVIKLKLVLNTVRNFPVARNWPQITLRNCLFLQIGPYFTKVELEENTVRFFAVALRNCRFASNWRVLLGSQGLKKTPCTTFVLLEIGPKSHCATVVLLEMGDIS